MDLIFKNTDNYSKVASIKALRALTGLGLKETKEFVEEAVRVGFASRPSIEVEVDRLGLDEVHVETLTANGFTITSAERILKESLHTALEAAVRLRKYGVASSILSLINDNEIAATIAYC